ncbi:MAG: isoprenylcysteine carboxylmethyltransferase family protein [Steroidobacteraceae bacterium]|jgi:protein-S-isoprenylcysteine O-methyltransferase Ste14|nr:isoprenylcysteine carboxylmethyltransferase family protein [Steroidobacteraceae bacterium]
MRALYRGGAFLFSIACYGLFLVVFLYLLAFLGNLQATGLAQAIPMLKSIVPLSIDLGRDMGSMGAALLVDTGLLLMFGLQHSVMARPGFKRAWTRVVPKELERSVYVLLSSVVLALLLWWWRPIPMPVWWHADAAWSAALGWAVMGVGVAILLWATFLIDHFELFGLKQGWFTLAGRELRGPAFVTPWLYKVVRHPLYVGWLMIFWGTPTMTAGHLLFASAMSAYILIALRFEERDLVAHIGEPYRRYQEEVPALIPRPGRKFSGQVRGTG